MKFTGERFVPEKSLLEDEIGYEHLHRYYSASQLVQNKDVLDLACGEGYGSAILATNASSVAGVDIDAETIQWAKEKYTATHSKLRFVEGSATAIPFDNNTFDVVVSFETIEHMDAAMQELFMHEIKRVLRKDGILVMSTPDKKNYSDRFHHENSFHVKEFYRDEFVHFIQNHFTHSIFFDQGYEVVSIISNTSAEKENSINLYNWNPKKDTERKYIITVASNRELSNEAKLFSSVVPGADKDFLSLMERLITMNQEIEQLGKWGQSLDATVHELHGAIDASNKTIQQHEETIQQREQREEQDRTLLKQKEQIILKQSIALMSVDDNKQKTQNEKQAWQQKLREKDLLIEELQQKLHLLYQESDRVKERLAEIYGSDGWKLLRRYYNLKGKLLPEHSGRYKKLKKLYQLLRFKKVISNNSSVNNKSALPEILLPTVFDKISIPAFEHPTVSVIIPAFNAWAMNYQCIDSIIKNTTGVAYEIILADDNSTDDTKTCTDIIQNLVHVRSENNIGFLKNCNHASNFAKGDYILFLNNDTKVNPNWLQPMVSLVQNDKTIGMVGSKLIYPDGRLQEAGGIIWNDASGWNFGHRQDPGLPEFNYVKEVDYVSGASILIRKKAWLEAGKFDERYTPAYCEDSDLAFTLRNIGYKVMYQPLSEVIHYEGYSHGTDHTLNENDGAVKSYQKINNQKFFEKWQDVLEKDQLPNAQNVFQARDRTTKKKTILVIDHYVPHVDKDAGSKTTFQYLELFGLLGLNIKFIGDNFFKHEPYTTTLQQLGIEVLYGTWYHENWQQWIKDNSEHLDYIYINRPHISIKYIDFLKKFTKAKILYYGHDLHFLREEMQYKIENDPKLLKSAEKWKHIESYLFEHSDIILTPSREEKEIISALNSSFRVETILPYFFKNLAVPATNFTERKNILFVGGFGHSPNVDAVEWFSRDIWPTVLKEIPAAKFIVVGSNPPDNIKNLQSDTIEIKGFVSETELQSIYTNARIAVIPIRFGAGVKGKTVEAMYHGLPIVSTSFGIEGMPGEYLSFLHPKNEAAAFADELIRLYTDENALRKLSSAETGYINLNFSQQTAAEKMRNMLELNT